jgi:superfamily I DNA/RNA helicase
MQDISTEPVARLIVDYLSCLYGQREPKAWICLMNQVVPFIDEAMQYSILLDFEFYIREQKKRIAPFEPNSTRYSGWWEFAIGFLKKIGIEAIVAFSPDYESKARLKEVIEETRVRIEELLKLESDLPKALKRFSDDQAVRIMTIHKSKGLEFDSVIILGVEHQTFWGAEEAERCGFFVGMSRAKRRLILTFCNTRETPLSNPRRWQEQREPHTEFLSYAKPFLSQEIVS